MAFANFCSILFPLKKNEWSQILLVEYSLLHPYITVATICDKEIYPLSAGLQGPVRQKEKVTQRDKDLFHVSYT